MDSKLTELEDQTSEEIEYLRLENSSCKKKGCSWLTSRDMMVFTLSFATLICCLPRDVVGARKGRMEAEVREGDRENGRRADKENERMGFRNGSTP